MRIAIRADGGLQVGLGHINRTLILAKSLENKHEIIYICQDKPEYKIGIEIVQQAGYDVKLIKSVQDMEFIEADCLITDSYDVNEDYFITTNKFFANQGYIDDLAELNYYDVDFLINHALDAEKIKYYVPDRCVLLLGIEYALIDNSFFELRNKHINLTMKDVLVTVGGSNFEYAMEKLMQLINQLPYKFHIAIGKGFDSASIRRIENLKTENMILHYQKNMKELMEQCDIVITSCGGTVYESIFAGIPTIGIILANNQRTVAKQLHLKESIHNLGWLNKISKEQIVDAIDYMGPICHREKMRKKMEELVNQKTINKICQHINDL